MKSIQKSSSYYRIVALWAICEAMIGGVIHGLHLPVSGLIVGSCAVICISLIAWYHPVKGAILKATIVVAIFKMLLSPQAPVTAYLAVFFQGSLGELIFWRRKFFTAACFLLAVLSLLESGLQRIIVLTIIYGNDLWYAVNDLLNKLTGQKEWTNYSRWFIRIYVGLHLIVGFFTGWLCSVLPGRIEYWRERYRLTLTESEIAVPGKRKKRTSMIIIWGILLVLYIQSTFHLGPSLLPQNIVTRILLRSFLIVAAWIIIVGPFLRMILHAWLRKKKVGAQVDVAAVLELLPSSQQLVISSWRQSADEKGWKKYRDTFRYILVNSIIPEDSRLFIFTGPVGSGKTTSLYDWIQQNNNAAGILTPVKNGKRIFMNISSGEFFTMEAVNGESETIKVGRFEFSEAAFANANHIIEQHIHYPGWLIIDEVGPLELRGEGFAGILKRIIKERKGKTLLVVRESLVKEIIEKFGLPAIVVNSLSDLN